jgi:hypothetical protein
MNNTLKKLSRSDIETKYLNQPIFVKSKGNDEWFIISDTHSSMPLHMLTCEESDLYDKDESSIDGITIHGVDGTAYLMWIYFNEADGWEAYGY